MMKKIIELNVLSARRRRKFARTDEPSKFTGATQLRFTQTGVPAEDYAGKNKGWRTHYWQPLKIFLEG